MSRKIFTQSQIKKLSENKNVNRCGVYLVRYKKRFKIKALKQYNEEGMSAVEIFKEAGFDLNLIGIRKPNKLMHQWNAAFRPKKEREWPLRKEIEARAAAKRINGGKEIRTLRAKVVYLEAANDFLAQLRARKRK